MLIVVGYLLVVSGCGSPQVWDSDAELWGRKRQKAFAPLVRAVTADDIRGIRLTVVEEDKGTFEDGPSRRPADTVITSSDPEVLSRVQEGISVATIYLIPLETGYFTTSSAWLVIETSRGRVRVGLSSVGFVAGDLACTDYQLFYSRWLAETIDELHYAHTGRHMGELTLKALSEPPEYHEDYE